MGIFLVELTLLKVNYSRTSNLLNVHFYLLIFFPAGFHQGNRLIRRSGGRIENSQRPRLREHRKKCFHVMQEHPVSAQILIHVRARSFAMHNRFITIQQ